MSNKNKPRHQQGAKGQFTAPVTPDGGALAAAMASAFSPGSDPGESPNISTAGLPPVPPPPDDFDGFDDEDELDGFDDEDDIESGDSPTPGVVESLPPTANPVATPSPMTSSTSVSVLPSEPTVAERLAQAQALMAQAEKLMSGMGSTSSPAPAPMTSPVYEPSYGNVPAAQIAGYVLPQVASAEISADQARSSHAVIQQVIPAAAYRDANAMTTVVPIQSLSRVRIGNKWYAFVAGQPCKIPWGLVPHLKEKGIIS